MTTLTRPSLELCESWADCVAEFEPGHIPAAAMWLLDGDPEISREYCAALIRAVETVADTSQPPSEGRVHADSYWVTEDQVVIGFLQLRHTLNHHLLEDGGHIGYSIRPTFRRRRHATRALGLAIRRARDLGLQRVLLTCDDDNLASAKTIESQGGVLEDVRGGKNHYWIAL